MTGDAQTLQAIVDASDEQVLVLDVEGRYLAFNRAHAATMYELYGVEIAVGERQTDYAITAADCDAALADHARAFAGESFVVTCTLGNEGRQRSYEIAHTPQVDAAGDIIGVVIRARDVTDIRKADDGLRESVAHLGAIASSTPDHILMQDRRLRYTLVINPQLGLTEQDMIGKTDSEFLSKDEADRLIEVKTRVLESGEPIHFETSLISKTGEEEYFDGTYVPSFEAQGETDGLIGYFRNVTDRRRAEQALRQSEIDLREAQRLAHLGSWHWEEATDAVTWSDELYSINGRDASLPAPSFAEMSSCYALESWERLSAAVTEALRSGRPYELDLETVLPDGAVRQTLARGEADHDADGRVVGLHGTVQDITDRKQAEEEIRRLNAELRNGLVDRTAQLDLATKELQAFAYAVSHHVRAPLRAIDGFSAMVIEDEGASLSRESLEHLGRAQGAERSADHGPPARRRPRSLQRLWARPAPPQRRPERPG